MTPGRCLAGQGGSKPLKAPVASDIHVQQTAGAGPLLSENTKVAITGCAASKPDGQGRQGQGKGKALLVTANASAAGGRSGSAAGA
jgi:hypothetical protein